MAEIASISGNSIFGKSHPVHRAFIVAAHAVHLNSSKLSSEAPRLRNWETALHSWPREDLKRSIAHQEMRRKGGTAAGGAGSPVH